jgi:hypothetical protein
MTDSLDESQIAPPSESKSPVGRYDKLREAGMATRFVKRTSGNPNGRARRRSTSCDPDSYFLGPDELARLKRAWPSTLAFLEAGSIDAKAIPAPLMIIEKSIKD